jgi:hypothetical protein
MEWTVDARSLPEFIRITLSGLFDRADFAAMLSDLAGKEYFEMGNRLLFDDTDFALGEMSDGQLLDASNAFINENRSLAYSKVAILTAPDAVDVGRKFEKITRHGSRAIMQIFDDETEAVGWLAGAAAAA